MPHLRNVQRKLRHIANEHCSQLIAPSKPRKLYPASERRKYRYPEKREAFPATSCSVFGGGWGTFGVAKLANLRKRLSSGPNAHHGSNQRLFDDRFRSSDLSRDCLRHLSLHIERQGVGLESMIHERAVGGQGKRRGGYVHELLGSWCGYCCQELSSC
jgi:hypothetical protein